MIFGYLLLFLVYQSFIISINPLVIKINSKSKQFLAYQPPPPPPPPPPPEKPPPPPPEELELELLGETDRMLLFTA